MAVIILDIMVQLSIKQERTLREIKRIIKHFGKDRWFVQGEVIGSHYKTMQALVNKGYLRNQYVHDVCYYQVIDRE